MKISTFTQKYEQVLRVKQYSSNTIKNYSTQVEIFLKYFKEKDSPKHISSDEIEKYLLTSKCINSQRHAHSALKLFYRLTVHQPLKFKFMETGTDIRMIQKIAGHSSTKTTEIYAHVSQSMLNRVNLPL